MRIEGNGKEHQCRLVHMGGATFFRTHEHIHMHTLTRARAHSYMYPPPLHLSHAQTHTLSLSSSLSRPLSSLHTVHMSYQQVAGKGQTWVSVGVINGATQMVAKPAHRTLLYPDPKGA